MISLSTPRSRKSPHACGVDVDAPPQVPNVVPSMGHFNQALLDHFWRAPKLRAANDALSQIPDRLRVELRTKLALKQKRDGKKSITEADHRRWELPAKGDTWKHWEVPSDTDVDYPANLRKA